MNQDGFCLLFRADAGINSRAQLWDRGSPEQFLQEAHGLACTVSSDCLLEPQIPELGFTAIKSPEANRSFLKAQKFLLQIRLRYQAVSCLQQVDVQGSQLSSLEHPFGVPAFGWLWPALSDLDFPCPEGRMMEMHIRCYLSLQEDEDTQIKLCQDMVDAHVLWNTAQCVLLSRLSGLCPQNALLFVTSSTEGMFLCFFQGKLMPGTPFCFLRFLPSVCLLPPAHRKISTKIAWKAHFLLLPLTGPHAGICCCGRDKFRNDKFSSKHWHSVPGQAPTWVWYI